MPFHSETKSSLANGELSLLNTKVQGLEKELEMERRKVREMQESAREKDREYQKLKASSYHSSEENGILLHNACYY